MNYQVWVSLTAYLQFVCLQPSVGPVPRSEIIGRIVGQYQKYADHFLCSYGIFTDPSP